MENGDNLAWACANCPKTRAADLHPYTIKLMNTIALQKAGYPVLANDLTLEEWFDLGRVKQVLEPSFNCPLMARKKDE